MKKGIFLLLGVIFMSQVICAQSPSIYCEDDKPMQFIGPDGKLTGMTVELVQEIQKRIGNKDEIKMVPWARGLNELNTKPNTILFSMGRTAERNALYQWIGPVVETVFGFYVKADSTLKITSLEDAKKVKSIGVYRDDIRDQFLTKQGFTNLDRANDIISNFKKLMAGRFDMYAGSLNNINGDAEQAGYKATDVKLVFVFLKTQGFIAASKSTDPSIVAKWNTALAEMKKDGTFTKIFKTYYPNAEIPGPAITKF